MRCFVIGFGMFSCAWTATVGLAQESELYTLRKILKFRDREQHLILSMRRMKREGAPPVILSHPVVLSNIAIKQLAEYLWNKGFDVWLPNMRGHGCGEERTRVVPYTPGDYAFDKIVTEDWPFVLDYVREKTKRTPHIFGYSMGGMTWEQFLSGVYFDRNHVAQSDALAQERGRKVASFVSLVTPPQLKNTTVKIKRLLSPFLPIFQNVHVFIPLNSNHSPDERLSSPIGWTLRKVFLRMVTPLLPLLLPTGVLAGDRISSRSELNFITIEGLSSPHTDYVSDLVGWFESDYTSRDGRVDYATNKRVFVPTLLVMASEDNLALASDIRASIPLYPHPDQVGTFEAQGFSHVDVAFEQGVAKIGPPIVEFLRSHGDFQ